ncbi:MAG: DNA-formamidopyrimidine glycosylase [Candidatus Omnitrophica bacterium]|nr:DNA-formamidopyrimidine glycosylase [Candidatus Omnitrophota bacterium]MBU2265630.1 DNA-formamidopyrimidine glycosylase [Candidatus Omnitrophota bacterium]
MPELPEVETIKRDLTKTILNKKIVAVCIRKPKVIKEPSIAKFKKSLIGESAKEVIRQGKLLIIKFRPDKFLAVHLRIAGWLIYGHKEERARVSFQFSNGKFLHYMDQRLLGELRLIKDWRSLNFVKNLGPEPFTLRPEQFVQIFKSRKTKIKALLLDQTLIAGLGNIYAQEALFLAKIDPRRPANSLSSQEAKLLGLKLTAVLREGIKYKGSSVDSYRDLNGDKGGMEERLKVYGRKGQPCLICKTPITKIQLAGRGTSFCSHCQK